MSFLEVTKFLMEGFQFTILLFALTLIISLPLGLLISFCSMSKIKPIKWFSKLIVWMIRGVPLMLQIFIIFYVPGFFGFNIFSQVDRYFLFEHDMQNVGRFLAALIAFSINYAAYFSEIFRGGIESVPKGQYEASEVLGMKKTQTFFRVILPQVGKRIMPPMSNEVITLVKDTSLAKVIMVTEVIYKAENLLATKSLIWPLFYVGVFYLIFVGGLTLLFNYIEKKMSYYRI